MAPIGTLWTIKTQRQAKFILAAAALGGVDIELPEQYTHFEDNKKPEFTGKFPHGKIPALECADGFRLFEGVPIARYIASLAPNSGLLGGDAKEAALVDQWMHFIESESGVPGAVVYNLISHKIVPYSKTLHTTSVEHQIRAWTTLNTYLADKTFLVHERISLADLVVAAYIQGHVSFTFDAQMRAKLPNVIRHMETVVNQPKLKNIYGPTQYTEKAVQYVPPAKEKKEPKPAAAAAPKAEKKPKAKAADDDDDEPLVPEEPKAKNPLDDLPKSTFNLEDWKRTYSNNDTRGAGGAIEWLYQHFDHEGFSLWRIDFKYNNELTQTFMSSNQIGGFFNRLEASRKYLFGSVGVLGVANDSIITGALILRGQDAKPVVDVAPDWESYEFKKLDVANAEDKAFLEGALAWDLEVDGKKWVDGKNFK